MINCLRNINEAKPITIKSGDHHRKQIGIKTQVSDMGMLDCTVDASKPGSDTTLRPPPLFE